MKISLFKQPSAWLPVALSLAALSLVVGHAAVYGIVHETDEGTPAHIFQILMAAQAPAIGFFAIKWLPRDAGQAVRVIALQIGAAIAALSSVYWLT